MASRTDGPVPVVFAVRARVGSSILNGVAMIAAVVVLAGAVAIARGPLGPAPAEAAGAGAAVSLSGPPTPIDPALAEASSGFDRDTVPAFLRRLVSLGVGFRRAEAKAVQRMVDDLDEDDERELRFDLVTDGGPEPLVVRAFLDDPDAVDLYFFGPAHLAALIQGEMERLEPPGIDG